VFKFRNGEFKHYLDCKVQILTPPQNMANNRKKIRAINYWHNPRRFMTVPAIAVVNDNEKIFCLGCGKEDVTRGHLFDCWQLGQTWRT